MKKHVVQKPIETHTQLCDDMWEMSFISPEIASQALQGQFIHVRDPSRQDPFLRRPFSICQLDKSESRVTIIYRIIGAGTEYLATMKQGDIIDAMGPLGNSFTLKGERPLVIGGGIGIAPLVMLADEFKAKNINVAALLGARHKGEMFWPDYFPEGTDVHITTDDGSLGTKGFVTAALPELLEQNKYDQIYTCGPELLMKAVANAAKEHNIPCQVSLERHMACGVGACVSCSFEKTDGTRAKACTDGPVFDAKEVFK